GRSLATRQKLVDVHRGLEPYRSDLAGGYFRLGLLLHESNRPDEAAAAFRQARELYDKLGTDFPEDYHRQVQLAWFLATCPAVQFRQNDRAVAAAQRALQRAPLVRRCWDALGIAQYRAGNWHAAVEALTKARDVAQRRDSADGFFLATAHWQLGDKQQ